MLKKWKCSFCQEEVLAFEDDIKKQKFSSFCVIKHGDVCELPAGCDWKEQRTYDQSTLHGEAGFSVEGTVLDSIDSIHDYEKVCIEKAADERELKHFLEGRKMV